APGRGRIGDRDRAGTMAPLPSGRRQRLARVVIEFDGETPRRLTEAGLLPRRGEVRPTAAGEALAESWAAILRAVESETGPAESAALMLRLLGLLTAREGGQDAPLARAVRRATHILEERLADPPTMPEL